VPISHDRHSFTARPEEALVNELHPGIRRSVSATSRRSVMLLVFVAIAVAACGTSANDRPASPTRGRCGTTPGSTAVAGTTGAGAPGAYTTTSTTVGTIGGRTGSESSAPTTGAPVSNSSTDSGGTATGGGTSSGGNACADGSTRTNVDGGTGAGK
jgi:hypothetical protein